MGSFEKILLRLLATTLLLTGCREDQPPEKETSPPDPMTSLKENLDLETTTEGKEIFSRAFWRRPTDDDRILHAERRQWSDPGKGVRVWQWFLAIKPGPELTGYLDTNPFRISSINLAALPSGEWVADPPPWLPTLAEVREMRGQRSGDKRLMFIHDDAKGILYAFDTGTGFKAPVGTSR